MPGEIERTEDEKRYKKIFNLSPNSIATLDLKGVVTSINDTYLKLSGYSREEIVGKRFTKLQLMKRQELSKYIKIFASLMKGKIPKKIELEWVEKNGTPHISEVHVSLIRKNGKISEIVAILINITERKKTEEELRTKIRELEKFQRLSVGRELKMIELKKKIKELEEKSKKG